MVADTEIAEVVEREAKHGQRMIEIKLRFWTNDIASEKGHVVPKHAWASGVARIERNDSHGIKPADPVPFNSIMEIGSAVEEVLVAHGIKLHPDRKLRSGLERQSRSAGLSILEVCYPMPQDS